MRGKANNNTIRDQRTEELTQRPGFKAIAGQIAILRIPFQ